MRGEQYPRAVVADRLDLNRVRVVFVRRREAITHRPGRVRWERRPEPPEPSRRRRQPSHRRRQGADSPRDSR